MHHFLALMVILQFNFSHAETPSAPPKSEQNQAPLTEEQKTQYRKELQREEEINKLKKIVRKKSKSGPVFLWLGIPMNVVGTGIIYHSLTHYTAWSSLEFMAGAGILGAGIAFTIVGITHHYKAANAEEELKQLESHSRIQIFPTVMPHGDGIASGLNVHFNF